MNFVIFFISRDIFWISKIQKNHEISKNRSKIEFWCFYCSKSPSFGNYESLRSFWCIYHSYISFFHLVPVLWRSSYFHQKLWKLESKFIESAWCKISFHARSTRSWRKVKIPKCAYFDGVLEIIPKNWKISIVTLFLMIFDDFSRFFGYQKTLKKHAKSSKIR